ncbi:MAG: ISL3 family transposase [Geodermatophilaceae bacterium]
MRATTAFNKMLQIPAATVTDVTFTPARVEVRIRHRRRRLRCPCGWSTRAVYDRSIRRWRHLDLGSCRLVLLGEIRRLDCRRCGRVRTEDVEWARPGARCTRDLEDVITWLAQRVDKTTVSRLLRVSWQTVADVVGRVVADHLDDARLDEVYRIGVDEVSYRKHHRYLTVVADHDRDGAVLWAGEGRKSDTLAQFYDLLGAQRCQQLQAVSLDMGRPFRLATRTHAPQAAQCIDPFHVIKLANEAVDYTRSWAANQLRPVKGTDSPAGYVTKNPRLADAAARTIKHTRWALVKDPANLTDKQQAQLANLRASRHLLWRAYELKEELRDLYRLPEGTRPDAHLDAWLTRACRSRIPAIVKLSRTIRTHRDGILAAVELGLSNSKLEGLNSKIRLINHRGYGHHSAPTLIAMIYLCAGGISVKLPTET